MYTVFTADNEAEFIAASEENPDITAAMDIETTVADNPRDRSLISIAISFDGESAWVIAPEDAERALNLLDYRKLMFHNGLFDWSTLYFLFPHTDVNYSHDTMGMAYLLDPDAPKGLEALATQLLRVEEYKTVNYKKIADLPFEEVAEMNALDAIYTFQISRPLMRKLRKDSALLRVYNLLLMPANRAFASMTGDGIPVDEDYLVALQVRVEAERAKAQEALDQQVGRAVNVNSSKQVSALLFEELGLPVLEYTATGAPSTGQAVLRRLRNREPVAGSVLDIRLLRKRESAFLNAWPKLIVEGRMHPTISPMRTATGRTSSDNPNIQQVPRDPEYRRVFADPDFTWIKADYSQIELRLAAWVAQDEKMLEAYRQGVDLHTLTAKEILGDDSPEARQIGKTLNFGLLYGAGPNKLMEIARDMYNVELTPNQASQYRREFFETYTGLADWHERVEYEVRRTGMVRTPLGRVRYLPGAFSVEDTDVWAAVREAMNTPIQSMASDILLFAFTQLGFKPDLFRPVATVHDEIDFIALPSAVDEAVKIIRETMEDTSWIKSHFGVDFDIPLVADISVGPSWGDTKEIT